MQTVFAGVVGERMGGLIGWGQWRACATQAQKGSCGHWTGPDPDTKAIDNDINLQNEYFSNIVLDGLHDAVDGGNDVCDDHAPNKGRCRTPSTALEDRHVSPRTRMQSNKIVLGGLRLAR